MRRINQIIFIYLVFFIQPVIVSQQLTQNEFKLQLLKAYSQNNDEEANTLIMNNRLLVKPFVNELIRECIDKELEGKTTKYKETKLILENTARSFESIFGEKSLSIAVNYLTIWSLEQKEKKLIADSLYALGIRIRGNEEERGKAIEYHQKALEIYKNIGDERGEGEVLGGLGLIYTSLDYQTSLEYYKDALVKREKVDDKALMGNTLNSIGSLYYGIFKDYQLALNYLDRAEMIRTEIGDQVSLNRTLTSKAEAYFMAGENLNSIGDYTGAIENMEIALQMHRNLNNRIRSGAVLSQMGYAYSNMGDLGTALEKLNEATAIMKEENDMMELAGVYNHMGIVLQTAGRTERSLEYYNNAIGIYTKQEAVMEILPILNNIGTIFFDLKNYAKAEEYHLRALQISRDIKAEDEEARCLLNLANDQNLLGKLDDAKSNYDQGLEIARSLKNPDLIWRFIAGTAEYYEQKGDIGKAVELNDSALKILEGIRNTLRSEEWKTSFMAQERYVFEDVIDLLCKLHKEDQSKGYDILAYQYAERSKSRALLDLLAVSISDINKQPGQKSEILVNSEPVSINEAKALCPDINVVILEYSVGDSSSSLWVITRSSHQLYNLPGRKTLQELIETIRFALLHPQQCISDFFTQAANSLYGELIKPAEPYLSKKSKLIIIPDGILNYLPFEVLLTGTEEISPESSYSYLPFLVKKYPVSYGQSASVLKNLLTEKSGNKTDRSGSKKFIGFGDPVYEDASLKPGINYPRLEYSGKEVENIASFFKKGDVEIYLRDNATEENVKRTGELKKFNYVHFATHGFIDEDKPDLSSLILTQDNNSGEDGFLQATEIFNLDLNSDLVVLSACQTGLGKLVRGEGIVGLTRAFMYAGTPSVLVSSWSVSDISTATLMGEFYKNLIKNKLGKTEALRKAQLTLMSDEKYAHPFYWAPFVLIGDWR